MRQLQLFKIAESPATLSKNLPEPANVSPPASEPRSDAKPSETFRLSRDEVDPDFCKLEQELGALLKGGLDSLTLTDNRSRIVSGRRTADGIEVRIHRSFTNAPPEVLRKVAEFLNGAKGTRRKSALAAIRAYFDHHRGAVTPAPRRSPVIDPVGRYFDLREIRDEVNRLYFDSRLELAITWGRTPPRRQRKKDRCFSVRLGTYHDADKLIRIHRALDRKNVPRYVVASVIHHEMLHAVIPPVVRPGERRLVHPPEFRRREREFPDYERAEAWLAKNLGKLAGLD